MQGDDGTGGSGGVHGEASKDVVEPQNSEIGADSKSGAAVRRRWAIQTEVVIGFLGALLGAGAALLGTWFTLEHQNERQMAEFAEQREAESRDRREGTYRHFYTTASRAAAASELFARCIEATSANGSCEEERNRARAFYRELLDNNFDIYVYGSPDAIGIVQRVMVEIDPARIEAGHDPRHPDDGVLLYERLDAFLDVTCVDLSPMDCE